MSPPAAADSIEDGDVERAVAGPGRARATDPVLRELRQSAPGRRGRARSAGRSGEVVLAQVPSIIADLLAVTGLYPFVATDAEPDHPFVAAVPRSDPQVLRAPVWPASARAIPASSGRPREGEPMPGFVGGEPIAVASSGAELRAVGERVTSVVAPYAGATRGAVDAAAQGPPMVAVARCGGLWTHALATLGEQVAALGEVADTAAADLDAAGGS